MFAGWLDSPNF